MKTLVSILVAGGLALAATTAQAGRNEGYVDEFRLINDTLFVRVVTMGELDLPNCVGGRYHYRTSDPTQIRLLVGQRQMFMSFLGTGSCTGNTEELRSVRITNEK